MSNSSSFEDHARPLLNSYEEGKEQERARVEGTLRGFLDAAYDALRNEPALRDGGRLHAALTARYEMVRDVLGTLYPGSIVYLTPEGRAAQKIAERESGQ